MSIPMYFHIHGMRLTTHQNHRDVAMCIAEYLKVDLVRYDWGRYTYRNHWSIGDGLANVYFSADREEISLEITGEASEYLGVQNMIDICINVEGRPTRLDLAVDHAQIEPEQVKDHLNIGYKKLPENVRTKANRKSFKWNDAYDGQGLTIGSRSSTRYMRIYNRNQDENGENYTRIELELKKNAAVIIMNNLIDNRDCLQDVFIGAIRTFVDFVVPSEEKNVSRVPLVGWWSDFVNGVDKLQMKIVKLSVDRLEKTIKHATRNAANFWVAINTIISAYEISFEDACSRFAQVGHDSRKQKHVYQMHLANITNPDDLRAIV